MQTLILPGYSPSNKEWVDNVAKNLDIKDIIRPFYWMHWSDELQKFNAQEKADLIVKHIRGDKVNIIAKSLGTLVACLVYKAIPNQIEKMVLNGIPLRDISKDETEVIKSVTMSNRYKVVIFQNRNDPHGTFEEVKFFGNVVVTERDDHDYPFFDKFQGFIK